MGRTGISPLSVSPGFIPGNHIDSGLLHQAMKTAGAATPEETIERALKLFIQKQQQHGTLEFQGKVDWRGDLDTWRRD